MEFGYGPAIQNLEYLILRKEVFEKIRINPFNYYCQFMLCFYDEFRYYKDEPILESELRRELLTETLDMINEEALLTKYPSMNSELPN